jgi:hypothetical protein
MREERIVNCVQPRKGKASAQKGVEGSIPTPFFLGLETIHHSALVTVALLFSLLSLEVYINLH